MEDAKIKTNAASGPGAGAQDRWSDVCPLILAAGKGTRMNNGTAPKVLCKLHDHTLIEHLLGNVDESKLSLKPTIVVGHGKESIKEVLGIRVNYVTQEEQKGTGHAVKVARATLEGACNHILVLMGDHPHVPPYIINELVSLHKGQNAVLTLTTTMVPDFEAWRAGLYHYGRIVRGVDGQIQRIVEQKDATPKELDIKELNVGYYCFKGDWLWENLEKIEPVNSQGEYYLTDLVEIALAEHNVVKSLTIDPLVSIGVNTPEQLEQAEKLLFRK